MSIDMEKIKKLREETGAGVMDVKKVLEEVGGDLEKAMKILAEKGLAKVEKRAGRSAGEGIVFSYIHSGGKIGSLLLLGCETDFVAKTDEFTNLGREICMQVAVEDFDSVEALLNSEYIRDSAKKIADLVNTTSAKLGEKLEVRDFKRFSVK